MITKDKFINERTKIITRMLDNPNEYLTYPTTNCFAELDDLYDKISPNREKPSWAQIHREKGE